MIDEPVPEEDRALAQSMFTKRIVLPPEPPAADETNVTKRTAKSVAEQITGHPVQCRERNDGRVEIRTKFRGTFLGRTWFIALFNLKTEIDPA